MKVIIDGVKYYPEGKPQPKPLLANAKEGDLCQRRDGKWVQIDGIPPETLYWEAGNQLYYREGNLSLDREDEKDIIHTEPLAEEGTAEWAWQTLMLCKIVSHPAEGIFHDTYYTKEGFIRCMAKTGWQLYEPKPKPVKCEYCRGRGSYISSSATTPGYVRCPACNGTGVEQPKPLLADAKVGDLCQRRDGKWVQLSDVIGNSVFKYPNPESNDEICQFICDETGDTKRWGKIDEADIIHTESIAPEGSAEWAWQMMLLGNKVSMSNLPTLFYSQRYGDGLARRSDGKFSYTRESWKHITSTGWKIYTEPSFAKVKVGDYVEHLNGNQLRVVEIKEPACLTSPHVKDRNKCFKCDNGNTYSVVDGCCITVGDKILAIIKPEEVKVKISLEGTVRSGLNESCFEIFTPNGGWATIGYNEIDPATAAMVRELIERQ